MTRFPQLDLEPTRAVAAFMVVEHGQRFRFPGRFAGPHCPRRLRVPPDVIAAGHHSQPLIQLLDRMKRPLLVNEMQCTHGVGECEKMAMAFFKMSSSCANRLLAARKARTSAASAGSAGKGGGQRGAVFTGQPQGFGAEGRIMTRTFRKRGFFHRFGKLPPNSLLVYPTILVLPHLG